MANRERQMAISIVKRVQKLKVRKQLLDEDSERLRKAISDHFPILYCLKQSYDDRVYFIDEGYAKEALQIIAESDKHARIKAVASINLTLEQLETAVNSFLKKNRN